MIQGLFKYENDLLKHHVRVNGWLPACKRRYGMLNRNSKRKTPRRLRYFTFCAVGAIDVLMLDVAKIIRPNKGRYFDTVVFCDKEEQFVIETQKRIPGAIGFPGNFINTILLADPEEDLALDGVDHLQASISEADKYETRQNQKLLQVRHGLIHRFPFDVINLDLEEFFFKPNDPYPGKVLKALRKIFEWQRRQIEDSPYQGQKIDGFSLMFTTQIGPPNLSNEYLTLLRNCLQTNIDQDMSLMTHLTQRFSVNSVDELERYRFDMFFKLSLPKIIVHTLMEQDWYVDEHQGISIFEFERPSKDGPYKILHLIMDVKRQDPPIEQRAPMETCVAAKTSYRQVVERLFAEPETVVKQEILDEATLQANLELIKARSRKYYPDAALDNYDRQPIQGP